MKQRIIELLASPDKEMNELGRLIMVGKVGRITDNGPDVVLTGRWKNVGDQISKFTSFSSQSPFTQPSWWGSNPVNISTSTGGQPINLVGGTINLVGGTTTSTTTLPLNLGQQQPTEPTRVFRLEVEILFYSQVLGCFKTEFIPIELFKFKDYPDGSEENQSIQESERQVEVQVEEASSR